MHFDPSRADFHVCHLRSGVCALCGGVSALGLVARASHDEVGARAHARRDEMHMNDAENQGIAAGEVIDLKWLSVPPRSDRRRTGPD